MFFLETDFGKYQPNLVSLTRVIAYLFALFVKKQTNVCLHAYHGRINCQQQLSFLLKVIMTYTCTCYATTTIRPTVLQIQHNSLCVNIPQNFKLHQQNFETKTWSFPDAKFAGIFSSALKLLAVLGTFRACTCIREARPTNFRKPKPRWVYKSRTGSIQIRFCMQKTNVQPQS